jgi:hypothetical protein
VASFEELADRLASAAEPRERLAAAEALAALDDRRVVPTLARALGDPDAAVRARVEELLGQFSRSDPTGHLPALLAQAERVAEALAAEVHRLRGKPAAEPEPAAVEPLLPPAGFDGSCALVRLTARPFHVRAVSRLLGTALRKPAFEVAREIHSTKGFLGRGVAAPLAARLVRELAGAQVVAGAVPMDWVPGPVELARLREPAVAASALSGRIGPNEETAIPWDTVELVVAARLAIELEPEAIQESWSPLTRPLRPRTRSGEPAYEHVLDVVGGRPLRRLRLVTYELDFAMMHRRLSSFGRVARLARELARHADPHRLSRGVRRLVEQDEEDWEDLSFISRVGFEDYVTWLRLLLKLGIPLPP